jgi:hypothetical protein
MAQLFPLAKTEHLLYHYLMHQPIPFTFILPPLDPELFLIVLFVPLFPPFSPGAARHPE